MKEEKLGWIGMIIGIIITLSSFLNSFNPNMVMISFLGVIIFLIGLVKVIPSIVDSLLVKPKTDQVK